MEIQPQNDEGLVVKHGGIVGSEFEDLNMRGARFRDVNLSGTEFFDVNLSEAKFDYINMSNASFRNMNLSDLQLHAVQMGGAKFTHMGIHPEADGTVPKQRPMGFEECDFNNSSFTRCDLSGANLSDCDLEGTRINGILVSDLLKAYENAANK